jgi:hypothetical protein
MGEILGIGGRNKGTEGFARASRFLVVLFLFLLGCGPPSEPVSAPLPRLHLLVLLDVSQSVAGRVDRLVPEDLHSVLDYSERHSGIIAFGSFGAVSRPFVRVVFDAVPGEQAQPVNVFMREQQLADQSELESERLASLSRRAEARERFLAAVSELLLEQAAATNLVAALERAEVFFSEAPPDAAATLVLISDLQDTTGVTSFELTLDPRVRLLLVTHSVRDFGILERQQFECFENVRSALSAVIPSEL